jgi:hypothetical protein
VPIYADDGAAEAIGESIADDILLGIDGGGANGVANLIGQMLGQGLPPAELPAALGSLGLTGPIIEDAIGTALLGELGAGGASESLATSIADSILPGEEEMVFAIQNWANHLNLGAATSTEIMDAIMGPLLALGPGGGAEGAGAWDAVLGDVMFTPEELDAALAKAIADLGPAAGGLRTGGILEQIVGNMFGEGTAPAAIAAALGDAGYTAEAIDLAISNVMEDGITNFSREDLTIGTDFQAMFAQAISGAGGLFSSLSLAPDGAGPLMVALFSPLGLAAWTAFVGAFGLALGGAVAGTTIGLAGTLAAFIPGLLDLLKGYEAYSAQKSGGSTAGMSPAQLGLGKALGGLIGPASSGLGAAETAIMPQITKFIDALTKAMPLMDEFAQPAIKAMSGFFDAIDKGMGSGNFKTFIDDMSNDVGPIMQDFGQFLLNMGGAWAGFLELFGGKPADAVGGWFVKVSRDFDNFINHVKMSPDFIQGMKSVWDDLGKVLSLVSAIVGPLADALGPLGVIIFNIVGFLAVWADRIVKLIPKWVVNDIVIFLTALSGIAAGGILAGLIGLAAPFIAIGAAVVVLMIAVRDLVVHWREYWTDMKNSATSAWDFLDHNIFQPIADFFVNGIEGDLNLAKSIWDTVWGGIKSTVQTAWSVLKPIFGFISKAISDITGGVSKVLGAAKTVAGDVGGFFSHIIPHADGGSVSPGQTYLVGEQGPELFTSSTAGTIIPNGSFGGSRSQQIVFQIDARGQANESSMVQAIRTGISATLPTLQAALARGAA